MGFFCAHQLLCRQESTMVAVQRYVGQRTQVLRAGRNIVSCEQRVTFETP